MVSATVPPSSLHKFYQPRDPDSSPFLNVVTNHWADFELAYPERFQKQFGFWRPVIRSSIDKFLKCGDRREGFARVRCPDCGGEFFVAFSCRQRSACPSCDQKRAIVFGLRLSDEIRFFIIKRFVSDYGERLEAEGLIVRGKGKDIVQPELFEALCVLPFDYFIGDRLGNWDFSFKDVVQKAKDFKKSYGN